MILIQVFSFFRRKKGNTTANFVQFKTMATIITYPSALEYWLSETGIPYHFHFDRYSSGINNKEVMHSTSSRKEILRSIDCLNFSSPVHVAVSSPIRRTSTQKVVFHKLPSQLPEHSFYKISNELYIASPEYCFLQAAVSLSIPELTLLANELCSIYIKDDLAEYGQRRRDPVTTTDSIRKYLYKAENRRGLRKARTAIQYALDRSNSPMESRLAVLAALPLSRGGYGLIKPELNLEVKLPKDAAEYMKCLSLFCDMVWKKQKVILEYDSLLAHLNIQQHFRDKKRATALNLAGYKVISVTAEQLRNFGSVEQLFLDLRSVLNMRTYKNRMDAYLDLRWKVVHEILLQRPY